MKAEKRFNKIQICAIKIYIYYVNWHDHDVLKSNWTEIKGLILNLSFNILSKCMHGAYSSDVIFSF